MGLYDNLYPPIADHSTLIDGTPGIEIFGDLAPAAGEPSYSMRAIRTDSLES